MGAALRLAAPIVPQLGLSGLLLWQDKANYLRFTWGQHGPDQVTFAGALDNRNVIIGRGSLPNARPLLRLERAGDQVRALCGADGWYWLDMGETVFAAEEPLLVGLHAIG